MEATTADAAPSGGSPLANRLDRYFDITARGSSIPTEVRGGAATFLTMAYILFVNPQILGSVAAPGGVKLPFDQLLTVTALVAAVATLAMGIYGRYPFALAAGLGINAFVAFSLVGADRLSWPDAMGVVVVEGLAITVLVLVGFREAVINAIPHDLKLAIGIGIGLFITIIGLVDAGIVIKGQGTVVTIAPEAQHVGDRDLRHRAVRDLRHGRAAHPRRAAVRDPRHHAPRDDHQRGQGQEGLPQRLGHVARQDLRRAGLRPRRELLVPLRLGAGLLERVGRRGVGDAVGLLRHGGHRPRPRAPRRARDAGRAGCPGCAAC